MVKRLSLLALLLTALPFVSIAQQLLINEISQGPSGSKEYVEFVVYGVNSCSGNGTSDLRGVVFDDNNGLFLSGSGAGIAPGALRFANTAFWSAIPYGTIIVVYNENDNNSSIPADDISMSDGNGRLILPANSALIEGTSISPTSGGSSTYPTSASDWSAGGGTWNMVGMANSGDSFQTRTSASASAPYSAVSWGNNSTNTQQYFSGSASGKVFYLSGNGAWNSGTSPANETPGMANDAANGTFIASLSGSSGSGITVNLTSAPATCTGSCNGQITSSVSGGTAPYTYAWTGTGASTANISSLCPGSYTLTVTDAGGCQQTAQTTVSTNSNLNVALNATAETCSGNCDGQISSSVSGGTAPYTYSWNGNGAATPTISSLCSGSYSVTVTDANGCQQTAQATVNPGTNPGDATITPAGPFADNSSPVQLQTATGGGVWTSTCGSCLTSSGVFSPSAAGAGTWQVCYAVGNSSCGDYNCLNITVTAGCIPQSTYDTVTVCPGTAVLINGNNEMEPGPYTSTFANIAGCDSTHHVLLVNYALPVSDSTVQLCFGDTLVLFGAPVTSAGTFTEQRISDDGCPFLATVNIYMTDCDFSEPTVYIPNVFTPNGDGLNDTFEVIVTESYINEGFILNRWGNIVSYLSNEMNYWDGKDKNTGNDLPDGVYTYVVTITGNDNHKKQYQGFVTLLR